MKVYILHASMYGHTEILANAVTEGVNQTEGVEGILKSVEDTDPEELRDAAGIIWGSSGYFGEPNPKMATFFSKLGGLWVSGGLQGKAGGVFATASSQHGGVENVCRALQTPMQHHGMILVSNTGPLNEDRVNYGNPYGATSVIPVESSPEAPMNEPNNSEMELARQYGKLVAEAAAKLAK